MKNNGFFSIEAKNGKLGNLRKVGTDSKVSNREFIDPYKQLTLFDLKPDSSYYEKYLAKKLILRHCVLAG